MSPGASRRQWPPGGQWKSTATVKKTRGHSGKVDISSQRPGVCLALAVSACCPCRAVCTATGLGPCSGLSPSYPAPLGGSLALVDPSHCLQSGSSSLKNESSHSASVTQPYREHDKWSVCSLVHSKCSISGFEQTMVLNKLSKPIKHTHHQLHCLTMSSPTALLCGHHQQPPF